MYQAVYILCYLSLIWDSSSDMSGYEEYCSKAYTAHLTHESHQDFHRCGLKGVQGIPNYGALAWHTWVSSSGLRWYLGGALVFLEGMWCLHGRIRSDEIAACSIWWGPEPWRLLKNSAMAWKTVCAFWYRLSAKIDWRLLRDILGRIHCMLQFCWKMFINLPKTGIC